MEARVGGARGAAPRSDAAPLRPERVLADLRAVLPDDGILVADVGVHHNWIVQEWPAYAPRTALQSWGFASMGFGVAGVLGAKLAAPDRAAVAVVGDGGFMLMPSVVATAVQYGLPAVWLVWNNQGFISIRDQQRGYFGAGRDLATSFVHGDTGAPYSADFAALARSMGADGITVEAPGELAGALDAAPVERPPDGGRRAGRPGRRAAGPGQLGPAAAAAPRAQHRLGRDLTTVLRMTERPAATAPVVGALMHGLEILDLFSEDDRVLGVGEMARRLGMHKSSASRLAATLSAAGYLEPAGQTGRYRLGAKLVRFASLAGDGASLPQIAVPVLRPLVDEVGETGHVVALDGTEVVTIGVVDGWRSVRMHGAVGKRSPAHATATGKALLSGLSDAEVRARYSGRQLASRTPNTLTTVKALLEALAGVRERGFALDAEELEIGLRCVAAPVVDHAGHVVAAIGLSGPAGRFAPEALAADVHRAAATVSAALGAPA